MSLVFVLGNHGLIPIYIPDVSYDILVNGIKIGRGVSHISSTINPGETKTFQDNVQDIKFVSIEPAITIIVDSKGMVNFQVNGIAYFVFLGVHVPIPFHSSIQANMLDEIKNHFNRYLSSNQSYLQNSFPENHTVLGKQPTKENSSTVQDTGNPLWNNFSHGTAKVGDVDLNLEVGDTPDLMQQGLQLQPRLPYNQGMFFVFKTPTNVPIWMPNMKFSIDVIWFDGKGNILRIEKNVPPCILSDTSKCPIYGGNEQSQYILEVTSGFVDKFNITSKSKLTNINI
jgi:uncharacterized membrane protein (UPF0127 family)